METSFNFSWFISSSYCRCYSRSCKRCFGCTDEENSFNIFSADSFIAHSFVFRVSSSHHHRHHRRRRCSYSQTHTFRWKHHSECSIVWNIAPYIHFLCVLSSYVFFLESIAWPRKQKENIDRMNYTRIHIHTRDERMENEDYARIVCIRDVRISLLVLVAFIVSKCVCTVLHPCFARFLVFAMPHGSALASSVLFETQIRSVYVLPYVFLVIVGTWTFCADFHACLILFSSFLSLTFMKQMGSLTRTPLQRVYERVHISSVVIVVVAVVIGVCYVAFCFVSVTVYHTHEIPFSL